MHKKILFLLLVLIGLSIQSQTISKDFRSRIIEVTKDTIQLDSFAINSQRFKVFDLSKKRISASNFKVDFSKAILIINSKKYQKIRVEYFKLPNFVTKVYTPFDDKLILKNKANNAVLYSLTSNKKVLQVSLFEGLQTRGFISRGITSGNNQNTVTNAALDLEISGKLSKDVTLRANIFDTNIPIQENGYSQNITDFDRIFIEMFSENWRVKAGDISLQNNKSYFLPFNKQVAGLEVEATINDHLKVAASGAIVRGKFNTFTFTATEGNQGPYKIYGTNNEASILMIEGSESVYVNGAKMKRGENEDYTINYNLSEISFNTTFPITNDMRIWVEFQFSNRNYTRFITYDEVSYESDKFNIAGYFYSENDAKNQPLQQSLSIEQKQILANAGNNSDAMIAESAFLDAFNENRIQYKKVTNGAIETFEFSTTETDELYNVKFTNVGANNGNYTLDRTIAIGNIFVFEGVNQGDYQPIVKLVAPTKTQIFVVKSDYTPTKKTVINSEIAISNNDANLFSHLDDNQNKAVAAKVGWQQVLIDKKWQLKSNINYEFVQQNFNSEQGWEPV